MLINLIELQKKYDLKIKGVVHIGAHFGQEYSTYEKLNIKKIAFFEPHPKTFERLSINLSNKDNVKLYNLALGNIVGSIDMNVEISNNGQSNSVLTPKLHLEQYPHITFVDKIKIPMSKLDLISDLDKEYNFINMDVQGYELEVLKGSVNFLNNVDYIMTEINREELYENGAMIDDLDLFLKTYEFERVETNWEGGSWGDAFYIKKNINN